MPRPKTPEETHCQKMSVSFTPEQLEQVIDYCQRNERSISWVIRKALEQWLKDHENDHL
jgi:hypothetical protein